jgi:hypothetical protein
MEGKVYQYTVKSDPTGVKMCNYSFQNGHSWKQLEKCTSTVGKMGKEWKVYQYSSENGCGYDMESSTTVSKMGAVGKVYYYSRKKWVRNEKCTGTL